MQSRITVYLEERQNKMVEVMIGFRIFEHRKMTKVMLHPSCLCLEKEIILLLIVQDCCSDDLRHNITMETSTALTLGIYYKNVFFKQSSIYGQSYIVW